MELKESLQAQLKKYFEQLDEIEDEQVRLTDEVNRLQFLIEATLVEINRKR